MSAQGRKVIMSNKDFDEYLSKIEKYTEKVASGKISSTESLESLVKAGICNNKKEISSIYRTA